MRLGSRAAAIVLLVVGTVFTALTAPQAVAAAPASSCSACRPGTPDTAPPTTTFYDQARPELGPQPLPSTRPVGALMFAYRRFGNLTADQFVARYRSGNSWVYPPADGFLVIAGQPVRYRQPLRAGSRIDRFGYSGGGYLAPAGTPFTLRALPPQNLNTPTGTPQSNYHLYCVLRPFDVDAGPVAPWFEQLGLGFQYKLEVRYLPEAGTALSVTWLLQNGYLVEERPV